MKCQLFQAWLNRRLDDGGLLPDRLRRHLAACPKCQAAHDSLQRAHLALSARPPAVGVDPSPWLHGRIMAAVQRETPVRPGRGFGWIWAGATAVAVGALGLSLMLPERTGPSPELAVQSATTEPLRTEWLQATVRLTDGPTAWLSGTNLDDPLQRELELVMGDARQAWSSLKAEFVPSNLLAVNDTSR